MAEVRFLRIFVFVALFLECFVLPARSFLLAQDTVPPNSPATSPGAEIDEEKFAKDANTEINVKNADIGAIVRIFSRKTKRNYILDERVKGKVSIFLPGKVSADESIRILDSVLAYKGFTAVPISENLWKIVPAKEAKQSTIPTVLGDTTGEPSRSVVTRLVQLQYVNSDDVRQLISQLISPDGFINAYTGTNSLVLIDTEDNIQRLVEIIKNLDVPSSDRDMSIIPVKFADAVDIAAKLNELLGEGHSSKGGDSPLDLLRARVSEANMGIARNISANTTTATGNAGMPGTAGANSASGGTVQSRTTTPPKIIADERTNSVIVVADEDTTARVRALIFQLDTKLDLSGNRFYVYRCQHASAQELADVLSGLSGSGSTGSSTRSSSGSEGGGDLISGSRSGFGSSGTLSRNSNQSNSRTQDRLRSQQRTPGRSRNEGKASGGVKSASLGEDISITADPATNSLIIQASKTDYLKILELLKELDIKRRQVIVEATLLEVSLDDTDKTSASFITSAGGADGAVIAQNNGNNIANLLANPSGIQDFSVAAASAGTLTIGGGSSQLVIPTQSILVNAARSNSNVNILSAPTILTTDNEEAEIVVGENVPFLASTATSGDNLNNTFNQIDRQDVGITLRLTPQISSGNTVTLKIFTEVSNVKSTDPELGPTTTIRTTDSSVITMDGQMVVMGGLMADGITESDAGVPFFKDIPVLGHFFRSSTENHRKTNLLILITPRIVKDQYDARDITLARRDVMKEEIQARDIYPSHDDVLNNMDMDRVAERSRFEGEGPTTILPPDQKPNPTPSATSPETVTKNSQPLEFKVNPKIPESSEPKAHFSEKVLVTKSVGVLTPNHPKANYIVMKLERSGQIPQDLPFSVQGDKGLVALAIPEDAAPFAQQFFQVGARYEYRASGTKLALKPLGVFGSVAEASQLYPSLSQSWYTLSPYEIMGLGDGPWVRLTQ